MKTKDKEKTKTKKKRFTMFDKKEKTIAKWKNNYPTGFSFCHPTLRKEKEIADTQNKSIVNRYKPIRSLYLLYTCFSP